MHIIALIVCAREIDCRTVFPAFSALHLKIFKNVAPPPPPLYLKIEKIDPFFVYSTNDLYNIWNDCLRLPNNVYTLPRLGTIGLQRQTVIYFIIRQCEFVRQKVCSATTSSGETTFSVFRFKGFTRSLSVRWFRNETGFSRGCRISIGNTKIYFVLHTKFKGKL